MDTELIEILCSPSPDAGYMEPRLHLPSLDPLVLEELYERGLLAPVALPAGAGLDGESEISLQGRLGQCDILT